MLSQISFSLFAQSARQQPECPPAGASQEVNEAAPSLAAPSASGQQAGTPSVYPPEIAALLPELRLPFSLAKTMGGWYLAIGCTRSPKWGRASIQQAGRA